MRFLLLLFLPVIYMGAHSFERYDLICRKDILERSERHCINQTGTLEESGQNDGEVIKYQRAVGLHQGDAYCAAGVYWCFLMAVNDLGLQKVDIPIIRTAVANEIYNDAKQRGDKTKYVPERHCLIIWRKNRSWSGHIERVIHVKKAGWVVTVGFNTSNSKGKQGVFIKKRNVFHPLGRMAIRGMVGFKERR